MIPDDETSQNTSDGSISGSGDIDIRGQYELVVYKQASHFI